MNDTLCTTFANIFRGKSAGISNSSTGWITPSLWLSETSGFLLKKDSRFFYLVIPNRWPTYSCDWKGKLIVNNKLLFVAKKKNTSFTEISNRDHMQKSIAIKLNVSYHFKITPRNLITLKKILSSSSCSVKTKAAGMLAKRLQMF